jgi:hypothetical protein
MLFAIPATGELDDWEQSFGTQEVHSDQGPTRQVSTHGTKHLSDKEAITKQTIFRIKTKKVLK